MNALNKNPRRIPLLNFKYESVGKNSKHRKKFPRGFCDSNKQSCVISFMVVCFYNFQNVEDIFLKAWKVSKPGNGKLEPEAVFLVVCDPSMNERRVT